SPYRLPCYNPKPKKKPMDVQRTIEFLLEQQAKHDARLAEAEAILVNLAKGVARHDARIAKIEELLVEFATAEERTSAIVEALAERQVKTEEMLQALIQLVERHIANHS
ncbi:MAG TPA: hypothetical protein VI756_10775, partial [Blastocatellia bacterium]